MQGARPARMNREGAARTYHMVSFFKAGCSMPQHAVHLQDIGACCMGHPCRGWHWSVSGPVHPALKDVCGPAIPIAAGTFLPDTSAQVVLPNGSALLSAASGTA